MKITANNNFCRVFELPPEFSTDYCFSGGIPTTFVMVDWFNPVPREYLEDSNEFSHTDWIELWNNLLYPYIMKKRYIKPGVQYLIITSFNETLLFVGE